MVKGSRHKPETLLKLRARRHSDLTKERLRKSHLGRSLSSEHRDAIRRGSTGVKKSEAHRRNISEARTRYLVENPGKSANSYIELRVEGFLKSLSIDFHHLRSVRGLRKSYCVDFLIPSRNLIIEVDGCYPHACPIHDPEGGDYPIKGESRRLKDKTRAEDLVAAGFNVVRIWGHDIKKSCAYERIIMSAISTLDISS